MDVKLFDFHLPPELIAQHPPQHREDAKLLVYHRLTKHIHHCRFSDLPEYVKKGDVLIRNNTRVIPARLYGTKVITGAHVELILLDDLGEKRYRCLVGNAKVVKQGTRLTFGDGRLTAECTGIEDEGLRILKFDYEGLWLEILAKLGEMPLPPYIKEKLVDAERYQTVYATVPGSAAAPTAGLHFTPSLFDQLHRQGVPTYDITLQIGLGTFKPIKSSQTEHHQMHIERYAISDEVAMHLNHHRHQGDRLIAIGTTTCRTLESNLAKFPQFTAEESSTNLFITPGFKFQAIDGLITNFHLPKSTLVMLVSSLVGRETLLMLYQEAIEHRYRFFSFGDSMLIL
jgi:S-adenosylmethionine:tRNA ribosyltransferase-isomerase